MWNRTTQKSFSSWGKQTSKIMTTPRQTNEPLSSSNQRARWHKQVSKLKLFAQMLRSSSELFSSLLATKALFHLRVEHNNIPLPRKISRFYKWKLCNFCDVSTWGLACFQDSSLTRFWDFKVLAFHQRNSGMFWTNIENNSIPIFQLRARRKFIVSALRLI